LVHTAPTSADERTHGSVRARGEWQRAPLGLTLGLVPPPSPVRPAPNQAASHPAVSDQAAASLCSTHHLLEHDDRRRVADARVARRRALAGLVVPGELDAVARLAVLQRLRRAVGSRSRGRGEGTQQAHAARSREVARRARQWCSTCMQGQAERPLDVSSPNAT
jgi:hypothetical protein